MTQLVRLFAIFNGDGMAGFVSGSSGMGEKMPDPSVFTRRASVSY